MFKKNNVVTEEIELAPEEPTALVAGNFDDEFAGDEDKREAADILPTIERYRLVQGMTQGKREHGLKEGQIYATASRKGYDRLLIVPVEETRVVIERKIDKKANGEAGPEDGKFLGELSVDDPKVKAALAKNKNSFVKLRSVDGGSELRETRNIHCAFLDPEDGVTVFKFGVLQAESTNIRPAVSWRDDRVGFKRSNGKSAATLPTYSFRTFVDGESVHSKNETRMFRFYPYKKDAAGNPNWKESAIDPNTCTAEELELLRKLKAHKALLKSGQLEVAGYSDADDSEAAQEAAAAF